MKKEKGFTLIELLAVIVLLAILMVVAVPKILNVIENSRKSAAESSIKLVKDAIKTQVTSGSIMGTNFTSDESGCYTFDFDDQENGNAKELQLKNKENITGMIKYCNGTFSDDTLNFDGQDINKIVCKKAKKGTLHTEKCTQTDETEYCSGSKDYNTGDTITYGTIPQGKLKSGDAFDCDVNGDGKYNSDTERFYYVTDMNDNTAVLIYYNNVSKGKPSDSTTYAYDKSGKNNNGPVTAIEQLPSISTWENISLINSERSLMTETGMTSTAAGPLPNNFNYAEKAARLLTVQELNKACNITVENMTRGELDKCNFLLENTKYSKADKGNWGYWLENPRTEYSDPVWAVYGCSRNVNNFSVDNHNDIGVRPVIEVLKSNIKY